jgi:hypothetical protein
VLVSSLLVSSLLLSGEVEDALAEACWVVVRPRVERWEFTTEVIVFEGDKGASDASGAADAADATGGDGAAAADGRFPEPDDEEEAEPLLMLRTA